MRKDPSLDLSDPRVLHHDGSDYLTTLSHLRLLGSPDGIHFTEDPAYPLLHGHGPLRAWHRGLPSIADQRHLLFNLHGRSPQGVAVGLRSTSDWKTFHHHGLILPPHNKDCPCSKSLTGGGITPCIVPPVRNWAAISSGSANRPTSCTGASTSAWLRTRPGRWDCARIGAGAAPIRTDSGWLAIYHGADEQNRYCLGAMLLDLRNPARVLARSHDPIMEPSADYERHGFLGHVVFTNGHTVDGDNLTIYYGASDTVVCGARMSIRAILASLNESPS